MDQCKNLLYKFFFLIPFFMLITWTLSTNLYIDESFTLSLIKHNWIEVIKLDSLDVHPPLYYLVLKLFLTITTFWTSSIVFKAIFARIFSVICFAIMSKGIQIIFKKSFNKAINFNIIFLGLLLLPNFLYHATCIRMYAFGAMLITWELVCLINYHQYNKISYLVYALILAESAAYTHYFAAIIGGLLFLYEFLSSIKHKQFYSTIKLGFCSAMFLILFFPWAIIALKQVSNVSHHYWISNNLFNFVDLFYYRKISISILFFIGFILLIILTIICYQNGTSKFKAIYKLILFSFYGALFLGIFISYTVKPIFQSRYLFFIFPLYMCFTVYELYSLIKTNNKKLSNLLILLTMFFSLGILRNSFEGVCNIKRNYNVIKYINHYNHQSSKDIILPFNDNNDLSLEYSLYLPNKNIIVQYKHQKIMMGTIQTGDARNDKKLFHTLYPNIKFVNDKDK